MKQTHNAAKWNPDTGELTMACEHCEDLDRQLRSLQYEHDALLKKFSRLVADNASLRTQRQKDRETHKLRQDVEKVIDDWKAKTGRRDCICTDQAHDAIVARFNNGYTVEHFEFANVACANDPWPTSKGRDPMDDIRTIAKNGQHLEDYARRGARYLNRNGGNVEVPFVAKPNPLLVTERYLNEAGLGAVADVEFGMGAGVCPVCTHQMKFFADGARVVFECKSECSHQMISDAVHSRLQKA